jgi:hypothetical protein
MATSRSLRRAASVGGVAALALTVYWRYHVGRHPADEPKVSLPEADATFAYPDVGASFAGPGDLRPYPSTRIARTVRDVRTIEEAAT